MFIYVIVCSETLKIYVGQHKYDDLGKYLSRKFWDANHHTSGRRSHLYNAMRKHPRESWSIHSIVSGIADKSELDDLERHYIRVLNTRHPEVGYNICEGGEGFTGRHSDKAKQKIAEKNKVSMLGNTNGHGSRGHEVPESQRQFLHDLYQGKPRDEKFKQTMSAAMTAYYAAGGKAGMAGKKQTEKWRLGQAERTAKLIAGRRKQAAAQREAKSRLFLL